MKRSTQLLTSCATLITLSVYCLSGCSSQVESTATPTAVDSPAAHDHADGEHDSEATHDHSGWWCPEHGVPEEECTRCDSSLIADFRSKDDWCDEHARPESQCFLCNPELEGKFAARYEAKYGEQPPNPTDP